MTKKFGYCLILILWCYLAIGEATVVKELYSVVVPNIDNNLSKDQITIIIQEKFTELLLKLTGNNELINVHEAEQYLTKYEYQALPNEQSGLKLYFNQYLIEQQLFDANKSFLSKERPVTMVVVVKPERISGEDLQGLLEQIKVVGKTYALPVIDLVFDPKGINLLDSNWIATVQTIAKKQQADEIITLNLDLDHQGINILSKIINTNIEWKDLVATTELENYSQILLQRLMQHLLDRYSNKIRSNKEIVLLKIDHINSLEDYVNVEKYLQTLSMITNYHVSYLSDQKVEFKLIVNGGKEKLKNILAKNHLLKEKPQQISSAESSIEILEYIIN